MHVSLFLCNSIIISIHPCHLLLPAHHHNDIHYQHQHHPTLNIRYLPRHQDLQITILLSNNHSNMACLLIIITIATIMMLHH